MRSVKIVVWEEGASWLGYLQDYPDFWVQGATAEELKGKLRELYRDLDTGAIPGVRRVEELELA